MSVLKLKTATPGLVLDYMIVNSDMSDFTFAADTTYLITGTVNLSGAKPWRTVFSVTVRGSRNWRR